MVRFLDLMGLFAYDAELYLREFSKSLTDCAYFVCQLKTMISSGVGAVSIPFQYQVAKVFLHNKNAIAFLITLNFRIIDILSPKEYNYFHSIKENRVILSSGMIFVAVYNHT